MRQWAKRRFVDAKAPDEITGAGTLRSKKLKGAARRRERECVCATQLILCIRIAEMRNLRQQGHFEKLPSLLATPARPRAPPMVSSKERPDARGFGGS